MAKKKPAAPRRRYSDQDRANALAALDANGGDLSRTARQLKVPRKTLAEWAKGRTPPGVAELRQEKKADLADSLEDLAHKLTGGLAAKLADAKLSEVAVALGIAIDKMRLLRGQATSIAGQELTDEQRLARLRELAERARSRAAVAPDAGRAGRVGRPDGAA